MPAQIKHDLNRSGWETTDFPSVCETCLPDNPFVQMLKEDYGAECKICSRPFTVFRWKADRTSRQKRTNVCLTCARLKNCCQGCMLDLSYGLSIPVRDAALKMIAPGPQSEVNKQWYAQEHEKAIEDGRAGIDEAYAKTDEKARDLLRRLARSEPYRRKIGDVSSPGGIQRAMGPGSGSAPHTDGRQTSGPTRTTNARAATRGRRPLPLPQPPRPEDILPPADTNIASLFITGIDDDLPEHQIRTFFTDFGPLRSLVVSHRSHCGYINFQTRRGAEAAAEACQGKAIIAGCPVRVRWGKPKKLDSMDNEERMQNMRDGRAAHALPRQTRKVVSELSNAGETSEDLDSLVAQPPPGSEPVNYPSLAGN